MTVFCSALLRNVDVKPTKWRASTAVSSSMKTGLRSPTDFVEEQGYEYYDMSREYEEEVRYYDTINMVIRNA